MSFYMSSLVKLLTRTMSFKDKVVLITGASSGIGAAIAIKFAEEGASVIIVARNETKLKEVAYKCKRNGAQVLLIIADVTKDDDLKEIISNTRRVGSRIDILINNAGIAETAEIWDENAMEVYERVIATNLRSVVYLTHLAVPYLIKSKGNIINISSIGSFAPLSTGYFAYCASKAGLDNFTRAIALDLATKGVRVNTVNPGPVRTDGFRTIGEEELNKFGTMTALGRISDPDEIADLVLFLASDKAKAITGSSFVSDNGTLLKRN